MNREALYAQSYDLDYEGKRDDLEFYLRLADDYSGPVLECACGTGRILAPLSVRRNEVFGFDQSAAALRIARRKIRRVRGKATVFRDELTSFNSLYLKNRRFSLIMLPFDSIAYLAQKGQSFYSAGDTRRRQKIALKHIAEHLSPAGLFAMDMFCPIPIPPERLIRQHFSKQVGTKIWDLSSTISAPSESIFQINYLMEIVQQSGTLKRWHYSVFGYQATYHEIRYLIGEVGLRIIKILGDFNGQKYYQGRSNRAIFLCRKDTTRD